jgi:hypothetical protein
MVRKLSLNSVCLHSENVVARDVQGELIIIPITSGVGDLDDAIFTLNETGRAVWGKINGMKSIEDIANELVSEFDAPRDGIEKDVLGLSEELLKRNMISEASQT